MINIFVYHNEEKIGKSVKDIGLLTAYTNNNVEGSEGGIIWVISAVGKKSKRYMASMCFVINEVSTGYSPIKDFKNSVTGVEGVILDEPV
ncbi:hypothetical protein, partial [Photobacterium sp. OFAV2-7]|uniref:hypothetical protein n=1 Tax=Photobacterium sp. OFAV2-7 TaxID=2917748 RepID=UPI001EF5575F